MAVSVNDPPASRQRIADVELVPVLLDLSTAEDVQLRIDRLPAPQRLLRKVHPPVPAGLRAGWACSPTATSPSYSTPRTVGSPRCWSNMSVSPRRVVPRRATLHDAGSGLTHKRIICWKRYAEGKEPHIVARETYHSLEAVDRYLGQYDRVRHCRLQGLTPEQTAHTLACSLRLVQEYLAIDDLLGKDRA